MSKKIVLTLELSNNIETDIVLDGISNVIGDNLEYVNHWEWMYE